MTDRFEQSARVVARLNGMPDYPFAVIAHPVANDSDEALRRKAEGVAERVVGLLTQRKE